MNTPRRGLGRGLGSLIPGRPAEEGPAAGEVAEQSTEGDSRPGLVGVEGAYFAEIPVEQIRPNPRQPRTVFDETSMAELVASIREVGLLQPVVVRRIHAETFELIMGERRWRAVRQVGLSTIPAIVKDTSDDRLLRDALLENLHRAELNPLEESAAYQQLLDDFGCTHDELARRVGRSRPHISNTLRLLRLPPGVQRRVAAGVLSAGHARALLALDDPSEQERLATRAVVEGISVRGLEELVAVGDAAAPQERTRRSREVNPELIEVAERLSDQFDTRCRVELGRQKGKIIVEFASLEDLQRILALML
jgi:ParB family transcriptional regulator, chromosome partitioning protein